jgi:hypothetical protein
MKSGKLKAVSFKRSNHDASRVDPLGSGGELIAYRLSLTAVL